MSLRDAAKALVDKLARVHASREYETVWYTAYLHNGQYQGPTYIDELDALRATLAADAAHGGWEEALEAAATLVENADDGAPLQCMADAIRELSRPAAHGGERCTCGHSRERHLFAGQLMSCDSDHCMCPDFRPGRSGGKP